MSNDSKVFVKKLAEKTIRTLTEKLVNRTVDPKLIPEQEKENIQEVIRETIREAYKQAGSKNRKVLKRVLSILLHPDKLAMNNELGAYLAQANLLDAPQCIQTTIFEQLEYADFWKSLLANPSEILSILQKRAFDNPLWSNIKRYPAPFNWLAIGVTVAAAVVLGFVAITASVFLGVVIKYLVKTANSIVNKMLNILTNDYYHELTEKFKTENFNQAIKENTPIEGKNRFKIFFMAVYLAVMQPINEIKGNKFVNLVIVRPLLVIAAPILFSAVAFGELANLTIKSLYHAVTGLALATYYLTLMFLNIPIAIYDFFVSMANKMFFSTGEDVGKRNSMAPLMLTYDLEKTVIAEKTDEKEPGNFGSPIHNKPVVATPVVVDPTLIERLGF